MENAVHYNVVTAPGIDGGGRQNIQNGRGPGLQLHEIGPLLAKQQPLQEGLLLGCFFRGLLKFHRERFWNCWQAFLLVLFQ